MHSVVLTLNLRLTPVAPLVRATTRTPDRGKMAMGNHENSNLVFSFPLALVAASEHNAQPKLHMYILVPEWQGGRCTQLLVTGGKKKGLRKQITEFGGGALFSFISVPEAL